MPLAIPKYINANVIKNKQTISLIFIIFCLTIIFITIVINKKFKIPFIIIKGILLIEKILILCALK